MGTRNAGVARKVERRGQSVKSSKQRNRWCLLWTGCAKWKEGRNPGCCSLSGSSRRQCRFRATSVGEGQVGGWREHYIECSLLNALSWRCLRHPSEMSSKQLDIRSEF